MGHNPSRPLRPFLTCPASRYAFSITGMANPHLPRIPVRLLDHRRDDKPLPAPHPGTPSRSPGWQSLTCPASRYAFSITGGMANPHLPRILVRPLDHRHGKPSPAPHPGTPSRSPGWQNLTCPASRYAFSITGMTNPHLPRIPVRLLDHRDGKHSRGSTDHRQGRPVGVIPVAVGRVHQQRDDSRTIRGLLLLLLSRCREVYRRAQHAPTGPS